jgi:hypothetical protein
MTDSNRDSQEYWQIKAAKAKFAQPNFYFGQQVGMHWEDNQGNSYYEIGEIIGMQYETSGDYPNQWSYRLRLLWSNSCPWRIGRDGDSFEPESSLVADDTDLGTIN